MAEVLAFQSHDPGTVTGDPTALDGRAHRRTGFAHTA
jgi:hypothetical protein